MSEEIKETYLKLPNVTVGDLQDVVDFMEDNDIEYIEFYEKDLKQQILYLQQKVEQLENIRKEAIGYVTSYESISTIQGLDDIEKNKNLDEKTMNEMINRYLKVHDILLNILNKGENNVKDKR